MFRLRLLTQLSRNNISCPEKYQKRNVQISVMGAASKVGYNVALLLKQNAKVTKLKLFDFDPKVISIANELHYIPGGAPVAGFTGDSELPTAVTLSKLILLICIPPQANLGNTNEVLHANAHVIHKVCKALSDRNPVAILGISANPLNSVVPFASAVLHKFNCLNPLRVFGITHIDSARAKSFAAKALSANPRHLQIPVIGGHSEQTVVPLLSNLMPDFYTVDAKQAEMISRLVKKAEHEVIAGKGGKESAILSQAWSIHEFTDKIIESLEGSEIEVQAFTANPNFGTRYFAGPTLVGSYGIVRPCSNFPMSNLECNLLGDAVPFINKDVAIGEELSQWYR